MAATRPLWTELSGVPAVRNTPLQFSVLPFPDVERAIDAAIVERVTHLLRFRSELGFSNRLHWLRTFGNPGRRTYRAQMAEQVVMQLTDALKIEQEFGQADVIVKSREGVRYATRRSGLDLRKGSAPAHRFQETAVFGEIGLPSSTPLQLSSGTATLLDVICDCLANLQLSDSSREPEWATLIIVHYLLPAASWTNRWGERISVAAWVESVLERDVTHFSCGGTHVIHALALLLQAESQLQVLGSSLAARVAQTCETYCRMLESTQHDDGGWSNDWHASVRLREYASDAEMSVHLTGHIMEAQLCLPAELRISNGCAGRALRHLARILQLCSDEQVVGSYCYYSHAGNTLLICAEEGRPEHV